MGLWSYGELATRDIVSNYTFLGQKSDNMLYFFGSVIVFWF